MIFRLSSIVDNPIIQPLTSPSLVDSFCTEADSDPTGIYCAPIPLTPAAARRRWGLDDWVVAD